MVFCHDKQNCSPQYLEDLATAYWFSEALFTAIELDIFTILEPEGKTLEEITRSTDADMRAMERFLHALTSLGLVSSDGSSYYNTKISSEYLVTGKENYQGDSILWRKYLSTGWQNLTKCIQAGGRVDYSSPEENPRELARRIRRYISAMDRVARTKVLEILPFFEGMTLEGKILDIGTGSGAVAAGVMERFPDMTATLVDIPEVLEYTQELMKARGLAEKTEFCPANILEAWPVETEGFNLVILSNIVHAYSEDEIPEILKKSAESLKTGGYIIIHDFFLEHYQAKAAVFDLNMFINTYNGKVFAAKWVRDKLARLNLYTTGLIPLKSDTAVVIAAKQERRLADLCIDSVSQLTAKIKELGFKDSRPIPISNIHVPAWADIKCQFGCSGYGKRHCPPNGPTPEKTRELLKDYRQCLLLEGEPPTGAFQLQVLEAEKEAFKAGFHKAFAYWAGPCSICGLCAGDGVCRSPGRSRPSMEGAGIDVFETVRRAGIELKTLKDRDEFVKYFALLLLE